MYSMPFLIIFIFFYTWELHCQHIPISSFTWSRSHNFKTTRIVSYWALRAVFKICGRGGWGGVSHMKQTGMLVVSLRGVNFGFWSLLGCKALLFYAAKVSFRIPRRNTELREEKQKSNFLEIYDTAFKNYFWIKAFGDYVFMSSKLIACRICMFPSGLFWGQNLLKPRPDWSPLGVTKSLSHAQMVSFRG